MSSGTDIIFAKAAIVGGVRAIPNASQELGEFTLFALERDLVVVGQVRLSAAGQAHVSSESPRLHTLPDVTSLERRMHNLTLRTLWDDGQNLLEVAREDDILAAEEVRVLSDIDEQPTHSLDRVLVDHRAFVPHDQVRGPEQISQLGVPGDTARGLWLRRERQIEPVMRCSTTLQDERREPRRRHSETDLAIPPCLCEQQVREVAFPRATFSVQNVDVALSLLDVDVVLCALMGHDFVENSAVLGCHCVTPTKCVLQLVSIVRTFHGNPAVAVLLAQPSKKFVVHGELWQSWKCSEAELFAVGPQMSIDVLQRQRRF
jgi:hypothetical protein